jgi:hypothetical protein
LAINLDQMTSGTSADSDHIAPFTPAVIASGSEAISGRGILHHRDCFVAQGAPRNDSADGRTCALE